MQLLTSVCHFTHLNRQSTPHCTGSVGFQNNTAKYAVKDCKKAMSETDAYGKKSKKPWECWRNNVAKKVGGFWYSFTENGWCDAAKPASNCTWRVVEAVKRVDKDCSDSSIYDVVEANDQAGCFKKCSGVGPARNISDSCWITCFYDTVLGPAAAKPNAKIAGEGMNLTVLLDSWNRPFDSIDPALGGCPALPLTP
jgi:hypothetical protein